VLTVKSVLDPHVINKLKDSLKCFWLFLVALLSTNHKCTHTCLLLLRRKRCEADRFLSLFMFFYMILLLLFTYVYCMYEESVLGGNHPHRWKLCKLRSRTLDLYPMARERAAVIFQRTARRPPSSPWNFAISPPPYFPRSLEPCSAPILPRFAK
jgi:hypothetical protein